MCSPGHFRGTANLSQTDGFLTAAHLKALGRKADSIPFTVVLDAQGRLTSAAAVPKLPTSAEQTKAPAGLHRLFD